MDIRLSDAAWNGNVETLYKLIEEDKRILHIAALRGGENPLHIACLAGHVHFAQVLIELMPCFAWELDQDSLTPLHIASAKGYLVIVKELLRIDKDLCLSEGMDKRIPLHCAVVKGRVEVVQELMPVITDSIDYVTARGETALHLAVKNNQFKMFRVLVEHIRQVNKEGVINMTDDQGNTVMHLAVARKLYQVVVLLLDENVIPKGTVDLNSSNKRGLTPLDALQALYQSEASDWELEDILREAGAKTTQELLSPTPNISTTIDISPSGQPRPHRTTWISHLVNYFWHPQLEDSPDHNLINFLLVISILVVAATYQAALSPPGGVWQEDRKGVLLADGQIPHDAGKAVMATKNPTGFKIYVLFNSVGFYVSISLICVLTSKFPMRVELLIAMFALCFTYGGSLSSIVPDTLPDHAFFHVCVASVGVILPLITVHRYRLKF